MKEVILKITVKKYYKIYVLAYLYSLKVLLIGTNELYKLFNKRPNFIQKYL